MTRIADPESLYHTFHALKAERRLRNRDAAAALGISLKTLYNRLKQYAADDKTEL